MHARMTTTGTAYRGARGGVRAGVIVVMTSLLATAAAGSARRSAAAVGQPPVNGAASAKDPASNVVRENLSRAYDELIRRETLGQFWGAVLVADRGEVVFEKGYGEANERLDAITPRSLFDIGSVTKPFTSAAIFLLEMDGRLRVDGTIDLYLPNVPEDKRWITVHHLLTHTSGISHPDRMTEDTASAAASASLTGPLNFTPGERFEYSNAGYFLLAAIIERASGTTYEKFVEERILAPSGMSDSGVIDGRALASALVTVRSEERSRRRGRANERPYPFAWGYKGAGGVVSSVRDLLAFDRALRGDGLLDDAARTRMFTQAQDGYACGWRVARTAAGWRHEHSGGVRGFASQFVRFEDGTVIAVLTNDRSDPVAIAKNIERLVYTDAFAESGVIVELAGLTLNEHGLAKLERTAEARVRVRDDAARIELFDRSDPERVLATIRLSANDRASTASKLLAFAGGAAADGAAAATLTLASLVYDLGDARTIDLRDDLLVEVMPAYRGIGEDGKAVVDERPTLVVIDEARSFWPVIFTMDRSIARRLAAELSASK
jgi:CubicO group peptidase (beta-lactamase class C family)